MNLFQWLDTQVAQHKRAEATLKNLGFRLLVTDTGILKAKDSGISRPGSGVVIRSNNYRDLLAAAEAHRNQFPLKTKGGARE